jgi:hypothetical protein
VLLTGVIDSTIGKAMEKAGSLVGSAGMVEKGRAKREEKREEKEARSEPEPPFAN